MIDRRQVRLVVLHVASSSTQARSSALQSTVLMLSITPQTQCFKHRPFRSQNHSGLPSGKPATIGVKAHAAMHTLVEVRPPSRQGSQSLRLPRQSECRLLKMGMSPMIQLVKVDDLHKAQMHVMVPLTKFMKSFLLSQGSGSQVLHLRPGTTGWSQEDFIGGFITKSTKKRPAVCRIIKIPSMSATRDEPPQ